MIIFIVWFVLSEFKIFGTGNEEANILVGTSTGTKKILYTFDKNMALNGTSSPEKSTSSFWWLSSGGKLIQKNGIGQTIQGDLPTGAYWQKRYEKSHPGETDNGKHPQNIFRLVSKRSFRNYSEQFSFRIDKIHLSNSPRRNGTNGIHLFNRYQDQDNLYYAGIRADGNAAIKKKQNGKYVTLAEKKIFPGVYDRGKNPILLPLHRWIGIKSEVLTLSDGNVFLALFLDVKNSGNWKLALSTIDSGKHGEKILKPGRIGIRTDFMDASFDNFLVQKI